MMRPVDENAVWGELTRRPAVCLAVDAPGSADLTASMPARAHAITPPTSDDGVQLVHFDGVAQGTQAAMRLRARIPQARLALSLDGDAPSQQALALLDHAGPGELLASEAVCDRLAPGLDAEIESPSNALPASTYRLTPADGATEPGGPIARPMLLLLPLRVADGSGCDPLYAELLHHCIQRALSQNKAWHLISRQSAEMFRHRSAASPSLRRHCRASHVVSGSVSLNGRALALDLQVTDSASGGLVWAGRISHGVDLVRWTENPFGREVLQALSAAIMGAGCAGVRPGGQPPMQSHQLLYSAMMLMHRRSQLDFDAARPLLVALSQRHPEASDPWAWLAKWHVMRVARRSSPDVKQDTQAALDAVARAADRDGDSALALAIDGHVHAYLSRDFAAAEERLQAALVENPSESLAWLYLSAVQVYQGRSGEAVVSAQMAQMLSPLDPLRYYYDSFAAHALLADGQLPRAIVLAQRSANAFPGHVPTLVTLALARGLNGQHNQAGEVVAQLRRLDPAYCIERFRVVYPGADAAYGRQWALVLEQVGLPVTP